MQRVKMADYCKVNNRIVVSIGPVQYYFLRVCTAHDFNDDRTARQGSVTWEHPEWRT